jgi:hypothetical protein
MLICPLAACAPTAPQSMQTIAPTDLTTQTSTLLPAQTATPNPGFGIDMEKFHNIPADYDHLLYRREFFVQAPDPIIEADAFDAWWDEELIPAIGPVSEREVNFYTDGLGNNENNYSAENDMKGIDRIIGKAGFFYFESARTIFPVLVINVSRFYPDVVDQTFCVALYNDIGGNTIFGISSLELYQLDSTSILGLYIHGQPTFTGFPIEGQAGEMIAVMGRRWWDGDNRVNFGLGQIAVRP